MRERGSAALARGNMAWADLACRQHLHDVPDDAEGYQLLGQIALRIDAVTEAVQYLERARAVLGDRADLMQGLALAQAPQLVDDEGLRYLLIKAWGSGFWSDLDHVLGQLLVAELTGRTPIVYWGHNSRFRDADTVNAFESFFQPTSAARFEDLQAPGLTFFPPKWHAGNLQDEDVQKWEGEGSRSAGLLELHRPENVVVSDFHTLLNDLLPWIPAEHALHGKGLSEVYRILFQRYIRLKPALEEKIAFTWRSKMMGREWAAVHVRGSDKVLEIRNLDVLNNDYFRVLARMMSVNPGISIFLLTDSAPVVDQYRARFGKGMLALKCERSSDAIGVHFSSKEGTRLGEQVIQDAWLASRCEIFIGNGGSNVSAGIRHLKDWGANRFFLLGDDMLTASDISLTLHNW
jgi:protein O-GlcNAc transferase